jgi:Flp pilus assembly protein TadD
MPAGARSFVFLPAAVIALSSCASHTQVSHTVIPAIPIAMEQQIRNAVNAGDGDIEIRELRNRVIASPDNITARLELGAAYEKRGYPELALDHYRLAADRFPDNAEVALRVAKSLKATGHVTDAAAVLAKFTTAHPQSTAEMYSWLGIFLDESGNYAAGEKAHRAALTVAVAAKQDRDYLHNNLGYSLLKQGRPDDAALEFRAALKLNPQSAIARDNLGSALVGDPKEAILNWQSLNEPAVAHSNMAAVLIERGDYEGARKELQIALEYNNANPAALANLRLISELDGKAVTIPVKGAPEQVNRTKWSRWKSAWQHMFSAPSSADGNAVETAQKLQSDSKTQNPELKP